MPNIKLVYWTTKTLYKNFYFRKTDLGNLSNTQISSKIKKNLLEKYLQRLKLVDSRVLFPTTNRRDIICLTVAFNWVSIN